jgi:hypothetical protein
MMHIREIAETTRSRTEFREIPSVNSFRDTQNVSEEKRADWFSSIGLEVLTPVVMKSYSVFWDITP